MDKAQATLKGIELFAPECAVIKVAGSECLDYVVDEAVQIYGGMGYSAEAPMDRAYRDARINRIFEGTNEINRMLIVDSLLKKAMKGQLDLMGPAQLIAKELMAIPDFSPGNDDVFAVAHDQIKRLKKAILMIAGSAVQKFMLNLGEEQEVIINISDMIIELYVAESVVLRVEKLKMIEKKEISEQLDIMNVYLCDPADKINKFGKDALYSFVEGDESRIMLMGLKRFTKQKPFNIKEARRRVATHLINEEKYCY
jgi:hypothetical protein